MSEAHTPAYKIFHYKYNYSLPGIHFYSQEYLDFVGIETTGNVADDKAILSNFINTRGTIMEIAKHYAEDHPIKIGNTRDAVPMYEAVRDHLANWKKALASESNLGDAPIEQLRILDEFATSIFEIARRYAPSLKEKISVSTKLRGLGGNGGAALRRGIVHSSAEKDKVIVTKPLAVHHPVIDTIDDYYNRRG
jgi:hypothetical protein